MKSECNILYSYWNWQYNVYSQINASIYNGIPFSFTIFTFEHIYMKFSSERRIHKWVSQLHIKWIINLHIEQWIWISLCKVYWPMRNWIHRIFDNANWNQSLNIAFITTKTTTRSIQFLFSLSLTLIYV